MNITTLHKGHLSITIVGLLLTLVVLNLIVAAHVSDWLAHQTSVSAILWSIILEWILILIVLGYVVGVERRPLHSVGLRLRGWKTPAYGVAAGIVLVIGITLIVRVVFPLIHLPFNNSADAKLLALPFGSRLLLVITAAVGEELLFRGYAIERIQELTGSRWIAGVVSCAAFTYAHLGYWGWTQLIVAGFGGVILTLMYIWRRDLPCNMLAHFIADGAGLLLR